MKEICPHFSDCGGCDSQGTSYEEQLRLKENFVRSLFSKFETGPIEKIIPSPEIWHYRNKMEYIVGSDNGRTVIGLRRKNRFREIVDLKECRIFLKDVRKIFDTVKDWMAEYKVEPYNILRHTGETRYIAIRHSKHYDELLIGIVAAIVPERLKSEKDKFADLAERLKKAHKVRSVYVCANNNRSDVALGGDIRILCGDGCIKERINGIDYFIDPAAFFQTNSYCCGRLYDVIRDEAKAISGNAVDMYCGSGGIALQVAGVFNRVVGVDNFAGNIKRATESAREGGIGNAEFACEDAAKYLSARVRDGSSREFSTVIVDPPRAGLGKKAALAVAAFGAENMVYVSCNPKNMEEDLKIFCRSYRIVKVIPVDMFPHTGHVEVVAVLKGI